jgi:NAD-dependent deacetylase
MKRIVFLTGAGISAESGLQTFRGSNGLWENHRFEDVACPEAWQRDPALVLRFYNERRRQVLLAHPNLAHQAIANLAQIADVEVITQNIDDLHERAGSTCILHLHGEIRKSRSTVDASLVYSIDGPDINLGDLCERGSQLRPHIVWFGEPVPLLDQAISIVKKADVFVIVGTSLQVYPAARLIDYVSPHCQVYIVDPSPPPTRLRRHDFQFIQSTACQAIPALCQSLRS